MPILRSVQRGDVADGHSVHNNSQTADLSMRHLRAGPQAEVAHEWRNWTSEEWLRVGLVALFLIGIGSTLMILLARLK